MKKILCILVGFMVVNFCKAAGLNRLHTENFLGYSKDSKDYAFGLLKISFEEAAEKDNPMNFYKLSICFRSIKDNKKSRKCVDLNNFKHKSEKEFSKLNNVQKMIRTRFKYPRHLKEYFNLEFKKLALYKDFELPLNMFESDAYLTDEKISSVADCRQVYENPKDKCIYSSSKKVGITKWVTFARFLHRPKGFSFDGYLSEVYESYVSTDKKILCSRFEAKNGSVMYFSREDRFFCSRLK